MKIMHVIHELNIGGAQTLVKNYMLNFDDKNNEVVLLCFNHENDSLYEKELSDKGVRVIYVQDSLLFKQKNNILTKALNRYYRYMVIKRIIDEQSPDIIHMHLAVNRFIKFARPKRDTKLFYTVHSEPKAIWQTNKKNGKTEFQATKWLANNYDMKFIVLHGKMKEEVDKLFNTNNSLILNNGIDVTSIKKSKSLNQIRMELGIPKQAFVLGHIGRFLKVKNHEFLADIFIEIAEKNNKAFLLMVGDGPEKELTVNKLNNAKLKGRYLILANREDVPDLLSAMDVFVFPSLYEGIPLSLIEAQIARKPCFVSDMVNEHAIISNLVTKISLKQSASVWSQAVLSYKTPKKKIVNEDDWDIKKETKKLEQVYLDALLNRDNRYNSNYKENG
ncbi:glycosyltransferase [Candidatus Saccharibacteria bacterium]|nr:glycosyltransferase [Candidatus Saccharibacteria bacterium]